MPSLKLSLIMAGVLSALGGETRATEFAFPMPSDDRWHYPFNGSPGFRPTGSCFLTVSPAFNVLDAYVVIAWDTTELITPGLGPENYNVTSLTVTVNNREDAQWVPDFTADEWFTYDVNGDGVVNQDGIARGEPGDTDGESDDVDPGRPFMLFGAGFGPFHQETAWTETSPYVGANGGSEAPRDPFPFVFQPITGDRLHVEDFLKGLHNDQLPEPVAEFTPTPWAYGEPQNYNPNAQTKPFDITFTVNLVEHDENVRSYFQEQLDRGRVIVILASSAFTGEIGAPTFAFPSLHLKEAVAGQFGIHPEAIPGGRLTVELADTCDVTVAPDLDGDCDVDDDDFDLFQACSTGPALGPVATGCIDRDFDEDDDVDQSDFAVFQRCLSGPNVEPIAGCADL